MHHRHFLVKEEEGDYKLREIDSGIASGISLFGIITGQTYTVEAHHCTFYFMNCRISENRANSIAKQLTERILTGNH